ncbi:MAG: hypothetical protein ACPH56_13300, partial [Spongiibacter marinus]|uniref:hypothetical protein n=1 Tax=Spongiibacter marinus TaxID=354246 RepID=UPI003C65E03C
FAQQDQLSVVHLHRALGNGGQRDNACGVSRAIKQRCFTLWAAMYKNSGKKIQERIDVFGRQQQKAGFFYPL